MTGPCYQGGSDSSDKHMPTVWATGTEKTKQGEALSKGEGLGAETREKEEKDVATSLLLLSSGRTM